MLFKIGHMALEINVLDLCMPYAAYTVRVAFTYEIRRVNKVHSCETQHTQYTCKKSISSLLVQKFRYSVW